MALHFRYVECIEHGDCIETKLCNGLGVGCETNGIGAPERGRQSVALPEKLEDTPVGTTQHFDAVCVCGEHVAFTLHGLKFRFRKSFQ